MNKSEAIKATKNGSIAAIISGTLTLVIFLYAVFSNASGEIGIWNDPSIIIDIILIYACAFGIYKKSRFAAVLLLIYFIFAKVFISIEMGEMSGGLVSIVFLYFYAKAIQGTFVFHKIEKAENPNYKGTSKWIIYTGIPIVLIFFALTAFGLMTMTSAFPSTEVQSGSKISSIDYEVLITNNIISKNDTIEYFYSVGLTSILEGGSVLTANRVIMYVPNENNETNVYELYVRDIASVELIEMGNIVNDSIYQVNGYQPDTWIQLALSTENSGDIKFIERLRKKISETILLNNE